MQSSHHTVVVATGHGPVRGAVKQGVASFSGIPYGGRVDGRRRFQAPQAPQPWTEVRDAFVSGPRCVQRPGDSFEAVLDDYFAGGDGVALGVGEQHDSENCLVLNVLAPVSLAGHHPVLVYVHGGGYSTGSGIIVVGAGRFVEEQEIVLVSVNHRLNVFGYLFLGELDERLADSGNCGLLDLVLALHWIRDNIGAFGGDPGNVTLFGVSGGGGKISALMAMPAAEGLFEKAVVQSGSLLRASPPDAATMSAERILHMLGLERREVDRLFEVDAKTLFAAASQVDDRFDPPFRPVIDGRVLTRHPFDPDAPETATKVALVVGNCDDETTLLFGDDGLFELAEPSLRGALSSYLELADAALGMLISDYRAEYPTLSPSELFFRITTDATFGAYADRQAERKAVQQAPVYKYTFGYNPPLEHGKFGALHGAELPLVLRLVRYPETEELSRLMSAAWASFARTGDPSVPGLGWPRFTATERTTMRFDLKSHILHDAHAQQRMSWAALPPQDLWEMLRLHYGSS